MPLLPDLALLPLPQPVSPGAGGSASAVSPASSGAAGTAAPAKGTGFSFFDELFKILMGLGLNPNGLTAFLPIQLGNGSSNPLETIPGASGGVSSSVPGQVSQENPSGVVPASGGLPTSLPGGKAEGALISALFEKQELTVEAAPTGASPPGQSTPGQAGGTELLFQETILAFQVLQEGDAGTTGTSGPAGNGSPYSAGVLELASLIQEIAVRLDGPAISPQAAIVSGEEGRKHSLESDNPGMPAGSEVMVAPGVDGSSSAGQAPAIQPPAPVSDQIKDAILNRVDEVRSSGRTEIHLSLNPPELGKIQVHLQADGEGVSGRLVVQNHSLFTLLENRLHDLREQLADAGVSMGRLDLAQHQGNQGQPGPWAEVFQEQPAIPTPAVKTPPPPAQQVSSPVRGLVNVLA